MTNRPNPDLIIAAISKALYKQSGNTKLPSVLPEFKNSEKEHDFIIDAIIKTVTKETGIKITLSVLTELEIPYTQSAIDLVLVMTPDPTEDFALITPDPSKNFCINLPDLCRVIFGSTKVRGLQKAALNFSKIQFINSNGKPLFWICFGMHRLSSFGKSYIKDFESTCWGLY